MACNPLAGAFGKHVYPYACIVARDTAQAVAALAQHGGDARVLAGGTDLLVELKSARTGPRVLVDITRIDELRRIVIDADGLRIGALATHTDILRSPLVRGSCPVLAEAARTIGAVQTRNLGTLGGNLASCVPSLDSGPALVALDARVRAAGPRGEREMGIREFFLAPRRTALEPDELLLEVRIPASSLGKPAAFLKFGLREGQALALVNVAVALHVDVGARTCYEPRIALGAVAPTVVRAAEAEERLAGRMLDDDAIADAAALSVRATRPITDFRASADYRRHLVAVLTRRALGAARRRAAELPTERAL